MKVLFINYLDIVGGAAIAASRLATGLDKYFGTENLFAVRIKKSDDGKIFASIPKNKIARLLDSYIVKASNLLGFQYLWVPYSSHNIFKIAKSLRPDIISLHNIHGGYFELPLLKKLSSLAPIVWTLHDMWSFTRNAAHTFGNDNWKNMDSFEGEKFIYPSIGVDTGDLLLRIKKKVYSESRLYIVAPSNWLYDNILVSPVFKDKKKFIIPNGIDTKIFRPYRKEDAKKKLGIPVEKSTVMFDADWIHASPMKGGGNLLDILNKLNEKLKKKIEVLLLGRNLPKELSNFENFDYRQMGYVKDQHKLAMLYSASDLLIYTSKADTLPNILIEAGSCGTPCIAFNVGGVADIIEDDVTGHLISPFNTASFVQKIVDLLCADNTTLSTLSKTSRRLTITKFDDKITSRRYFQLFKAIIKGEV